MDLKDRWIKKSRALLAGQTHQSEDRPGAEVRLAGKNPGAQSWEGVKLTAATQPGVFRRRVFTFF